MYKIVVFIPASQLHSVKEAMFAAGAGRQGRYRRCAWEVLGQGQFEAMPGSDPYCGEVGKLHTEPEWRVEMLCDAEHLAAVVTAMRNAHPYEEPAFDLIATVDPGSLLAAGKTPIQQ